VKTAASCNDSESGAVRFMSNVGNNQPDTMSYPRRQTFVSHRRENLACPTLTQFSMRRHSRTVSLIVLLFDTVSDPKSQGTSKRDIYLVVV
jgi:hypothetical protein